MWGSDTGKGRDMSIEAMKMALEALEIVYGKGKRCEAAINALRQALAEPDLAKVGEVGVWGHKREWVGLTVNEARDFYEKYTNREELIYAIDKFLEEKNA